MLVTTLYPDTRAKILPAPAPTYAEGQTPEPLPPIHLLWAANRLPAREGKRDRGATCGIAADRDLWTIKRDLGPAPEVFATRDVVLVPAYVVRLTPTDAEPGPVTLRWAVNHQADGGGGGQQVLRVEFRPDGYQLAVIPADEYRGGRNAPPRAAGARPPQR